MADIGHVDVNIPYKNISQLKFYDGTDVTANNKTYQSFVTKITDDLNGVAEDADGWFDAVDTDEMGHANAAIKSIFNNFVEALANYKRDVSNAKTEEEFEIVRDDFNSNFINQLVFVATDVGSGRSYISSDKRGPFTHTWYDEAKDVKYFTSDDIGSYRLIGELVNRVYKIFQEASKKAAAISADKLKALSGKDSNKDSNNGSNNGTNNGGNGTTTNNIESRIRSLFNKKSQLEQKQASLIKTITALTNDARRLYVKQFLNEDEAQPPAATASAQPPAATTTTPEASGSGDTTEIIKVSPDHPVYTALKDLFARRDQLFKYYEDSVKYFNKISKNAKLLQNLSSGKYKDYKNMSMEDRISAFNNAKYEFKDNKTATTPTSAASGGTASTATSGTTKSTATPTTTQPTATPTRQ